MDQTDELYSATVANILELSLSTPAAGKQNVLRRNNVISIEKLSLNSSALHVTKRPNKHTTDS